MSFLNTLVVSTQIAMGTPPGGPGQQQQGSLLGMLVPMICIFGIMYMLMIRPQMKKEKERKKLIESTKAGDRVLFCGGMIGTIANVKEQTFVVKIADNVKVEIARGAVIRVLEKDEAPGEVDKNA